jgi:hypothetical protein
MKAVRERGRGKRESDINFPLNVRKQRESERDGI